MHWERADSGYLGAALLAAALVVYFVAGNFGLVPSPLGGRPALNDPSIVVPSFALRPLAVVPPVPAAPRHTAGHPRAAHSRVRGRADRTPPAVTITTPPGTHLALASNASVAGTAADDESGVRRVDVAFTDGSGLKHTKMAALSCGDTGEERCTWSADVPDVVGTYTVAAVASDRAANSSRAKPIVLSVIDLSRATGGAVGGTVRTTGSLIDLLAGALRTLLGHGSHEPSPILGEMSARAVLLGLT